MVEGGDSGSWVINGAERVLGFWERYWGFCHRDCVSSVDDGGFLAYSGMLGYPENLLCVFVAAGAVENIFVFRNTVN